MSLDTNMSLDNTSHPGRPGPDELVPSRYALRVGEIDVMVVSDGVLSLPGAMLGHNVDPAVRAAWLEDMFLPPDVLEWALNVVVVRSGGRALLIDARVGADGPATGGSRHRSRIRDRRGAHAHAHGPRWRAARRRSEGPAASGPAHPRGGRRNRVLGVARFFPRLHAAGVPGRSSADGQAVPAGVPEPVADVRGEARGGAGGARHTHWRPHPRAQRGPPGIRQRPADVRRRRRVPGRSRAPRLGQRLRTRPPGGGPRPGPSSAGAGGEPRVA